jgi:hypothetical protein
VRADGVDAPGQGIGGGVPACTTAKENKARATVNVNVNVNELRLGFSNTTRNPEGILSHNNRKS